MNPRTTLRTAAVALIAGLVPVACREDRIADDVRAPVLLSAERNTADTLEARLAGHQRDLVTALLTRDSVMLRRLLTTEFRAYDTRAEGPATPSVDRAARSHEFSYFQVMAGALAERLDTLYTTFRTVTAGETATVFATGPDDALRTSWRQQHGEWKAVQLIIVQTDAVRRELEAR